MFFGLKGRPLMIWGAEEKSKMDLFFSAGMPFEYDFFWKISVQKGLWIFFSLSSGLPQIIDGCPRTSMLLMFSVATLVLVVSCGATFAFTSIWFGWIASMDLGGDWSNFCFLVGGLVSGINIANLLNIKINITPRQKKRNTWFRISHENRGNYPL